MPITDIMVYFVMACVGVYIVAVSYMFWRMGKGDPGW